MPADGGSPWLGIPLPVPGKRAIVMLGLAICCVFSQNPVQAANAYAVDHAKSYLLAITGKAGLFGFAGHEHAVLAKEWSLDSTIHPSSLADSTVTITIPVSSLVIDSEEARRLAGLGAGPGPADVAKIQERMLGPEFMDAATHSTIRFTTSSVSVSREGALRVTGQFHMHGQTRQITVPLGYTRNGDGSFEFQGDFEIKQRDFGIEPDSAGLGTVKVKNEVRIRFTALVRPVP